MRLRGICLVCLTGLAWTLLVPPAGAAPREAPPPAKVAQLLKSEPFTLETWPAWKKRLLDWAGDEALRTNPAFAAARTFVRDQVDARGNLPKLLDKDALACYLLGSMYLEEATRDPKDKKARDRAKRFLEWSARQDGKFPYVHRDLGSLFILINKPNDARKQFAEARRLDPALAPRLIKQELQLAQKAKDHKAVEELGKEALRVMPEDVEAAHLFAQAVLANDRRRGPRAPMIKPAVEKFPRDGTLACYYAAALTKDHDVPAASKELQRARQLGVDPAKVLDAAVVKSIEDRAPAVLTQPAGAEPSAQELAALRDNTLSLANWDAWKGRFRLWRDNPDSKAAHTALIAAQQFLKAQADPRKGKLPGGPLDRDPVAWYLLGLAYLRDSHTGQDVKVQAAQAKLGDEALAVSVNKEPGYARGRLEYARAMIRRDELERRASPGKRPDEGRLNHANEQLTEARRLDPRLPGLPARQLGQLALDRNQPGEAERHFRKALEGDRDDRASLEGLARAIQRDSRKPPAVRAQAIRGLIDQYPQNGLLWTFHGDLMNAQGDPKTAAHDFEKARSLGTDPDRVFNRPGLVQQTQKAAETPLLEKFIWMMLYWGVIYTLVIALMAGTGLLLARMNKGRRALHLLDEAPTELVASGQAVRTQHETLLTKLYAWSLILGLILFYLAVPFVILGLLFITLICVLIALCLRRADPMGTMGGSLVKASGGGTWAVVKCIFARFSDGSFGVLKTREDCPRLYQVLDDVAKRVNTEPVDQVYVAPGSEIGVHQEGRGPFGIFGTKRRVLTLGLSTLHYLTVSEFRSIMAHEYAHFSHQDTFYSRFIYQVSLSIRKALNGMKEAGGWIAWVNPFYWFFFLYNRAYAMLSSGFSRSREFLADRMACSLYGSNTFGSALTKVCIHGSLFESSMYKKIVALMKKKKAYVNMYQAFREMSEEKFTKGEREKLYQKLLDERESLFASHPTYAERIDAIKPLPKALKTNTNSARLLFEDPDEIEKELTDFLTGFFDYLRRYYG